MTTRLITPTLVEPVSLVEAKAHLRVTHSAEDALIGMLISAARGQCEHILERSTMTQVWELVLNSFPSSDDIKLQYPPIVSISSVKYISAANGNEVTLATNQYSLDKDSEPGWLMPVESWPETEAVANAVRIRYTAGYADAASVPAQIKVWILLAVAFWYKNREGGTTDVQAFTLPHDFYAGLLDAYRIY